MTPRQMTAYAGEVARVLFVLVLAFAISGALFVAIGYLLHLGWVVFR